ncbi:MAG: ABC transporter ATP-binding protein [Eubacteriales bacterium]
MKSLWKYLNGYKKQAVLAPVFKMLEALFELFVPLVIAGIIDVGIVQGDYAYLAKMGGILVGLGMVGLTCSITAQYYAAKAAVGFGARLKEALFTKINSFSYAQMDEVGISTLLTRVTSDATQVQTGLNLVLRLFLRSPFIITGAIIAAFYLDPRSAIVFVIAIPLLAIAVFSIMFYTMPLYKGVQRKLDHVLLNVRENLAGIRVIRAFNRQEREVETFNQEARELRSMQLHVGRISATLNPITYIIVNSAMIALLLIGGDQVSMGIIETGTVVALVNYMSQILVELVKLANLIINVTKAIASANRIVEVFEMEEGMVDGEQNLSGPIQSIRFDEVSFSYSNTKEHSLRHISFTMNQGETLGVIGSTGSGKTTLVNLIPRYYDATEGVVLINGQNVNEYKINSLHKAIRMVPQKAVLFQGTIRENLRVGKRDATDEEMLLALERAQAKDMQGKEHNILDKEIAEGGKNLSGGQRQRLTIARALVNQPSVLILDDSSSALDNQTDMKLRKALRTIAPYCITVLVSQRATSIKHANQILVLEEGEMVGLGTHEELMESCIIYREICLSQLEESECNAHNRGCENEQFQ